MSPAAKAAADLRAEADHKARAEVAAAAKAEKAVRNVKPKRHFADTPVPEVRSGRTSPAAQARSYLAASLATGIEAIARAQSDIALSSDEAKMVLQLEDDRKRLKEFKATDRKIEAKAAMLPFYEGWIAGFMANAKHEAGPMDQVFTQLLAWTIDVGAYDAALPMIEHALDLGLDMPGHFNRDVVTFAIDEISDAALFAFDLGGERASTFEAGILPKLQDLVEVYEVDLHDEVEAKLFKAIGRAILAGADDANPVALRARQQSALAAYQSAIAKHERVGVKKDIERLERELKKSDPAATPPAA